VRAKALLHACVGIQICVLLIATSNQLKRWLASHGCTFEEGSKHTKVFRNGKFTSLPRHGGKELPTGTVQGIKKALGLK
jgi:mRNA interferase HicA